MSETETHIVVTGPEGEEIDILIEPREMEPEPPVEEATIAWDPSLHPRTRLGQWARTWGWIGDALEHLQDQPVPGRLLQGEPRKRGTKRGRKSPIPKPRVVGWKEKVEGLRQPSIQQDFLMKKLKGSWFGKRIESGHEGEKYEGDPEATARVQEFHDWWNGAMQTISGDPGALFEAQHARIMEAGALLDAEVKRRIAADPTTKERTRVKKEINAAHEVLRQAEEEHDRAGWEVVAKSMNSMAGPRTPEEWKALYLDYDKDRVRRSGKSKYKEFSADWHEAATVWDHWEYRYSDAEHQGVDLQGLYDKVYEAKGVAWDLERELEPLDERAKTLRRDKAYEVLMEIRDFADGEDLDVHEEHPPYSLIPYDYEKDRYRNGMISLREATKWLPHDWIKSSNAADRSHKLAMTWKFDGRGKYSHQYAASLQTGQGVSLITATPSKEVAGLRLGEATMLHELIHRVEATRDGIKGAEWAFYVSRVSPGRNQKWQETRPLPEVVEGSYEPHEMTRTDEFPDPYAGKTYGDEMNSTWEILTMGIEDLVSGEHGIIARDEEYRQFVLGSMALL